MSELTLTQASEEFVRTLSKSRQEPEWLQEFRIKSLNLFHNLAPELSSLYTKYVDLTGLDLESLNLKLPEPTKTTTEDIVSKLKTERALTIYQIESKTILPEVPAPLQKEGLAFTDIGTVIRKDPEYFRRYFLEKAILPEADKFAALNNALFTSGIFLHVPKGIEVTLPFRQVTILDSEGGGLFAQNLVMAEPRSKFTVLEELYSTRLTGQVKKSAYSGLSEVHLRDGAEVTYASINNLAPNVNIFMNKKSIGERDSKIVWSSGLLGGAYTRSRLESAMTGRGASSENVEVVFGAGTQRFDAVSNITHIGENTSGHAISKGVVKDKARSLFKGMIRIEKTAKNSRAYLAEHGMILGKDALADAIPGLEIETNEVKATHSASVSQINDEQIFYLMARGLSEDEAKKLIIVGFFEPLIERIPVPDVAKRIRRIVDLKWSGIYDFSASLTTPAYDDEYYEEETRKTKDIFEGHYKYRE
ncbi:MAG: Fe-S cluster assembly protein SufD [Candidatus Bathyarchaeia archaeon]|jgi:FeS assembly protein SufD